MTVLAGRRESFNAAHQLREPGLLHERNRRLSGKCANLHGHNYVLEVVVAGQIDPATGHVADLNLLPDVISGQILRDVDHRKPDLPGGVDVRVGGTQLRVGDDAVADLKAGGLGELDVGRDPDADDDRVGLDVGSVGQPHAVSPAARPAAVVSRPIQPAPITATRDAAAKAALIWSLSATRRR